MRVPRSCYLESLDTIPSRALTKKRKPHPRDGAPSMRTVPGGARRYHDLSRDFFQLLLIDIEVRVHVLHVVLVFQGFEQTKHCRGLLAF